jgi:hypothetical protein
MDFHIVKMYKDKEVNKEAGILLHKKSTKHRKTNTRQNNTRKTGQYIKSRILDKTIGGKQYKTSQADCN